MVAAPRDRRHSHRLYESRDNQLNLFPHSMMASVSGSANVDGSLLMTWLRAPTAPVKKAVYSTLSTCLSTSFHIVRLTTVVRVRACSTAKAPSSRYLLLGPRADSSEELWILTTVFFVLAYKRYAFPKRSTSAGLLPSPPTASPKLSHRSACSASSIVFCAEFAMTFSWLSYR